MSKFVAIGMLSAFSFSLVTPVQAQQTLFDANWGVINKIENRRMMNNGSTSSSFDNSSTVSSPKSSLTPAQREKCGEYSAKIRNRVSKGDSLLERMVGLGEGMNEAAACLKENE